MSFNYEDDKITKEDVKFIINKLNKWKLIKGEWYGREIDWSKNKKF